MKSVFAINGSAGENSSCQRLIEYFADLTKAIFKVTIFSDLKTLPHFDPELSITNTPMQILELRRSIETCDGILICTPEYIFSIPAGLKNAFEWCASTTLFADKPTGIITASASGQKGHEELQLILKTLMAEFSRETTLLIQGIRGKIDEQGRITDENTRTEVLKFIEAFEQLMKKT